AEGQGRVDLVLDLDQRVENHRPAFGEIERVGVDDRVAAVLGVPAVDAEPAQPLRARRRRPGLAGTDLRVRRQGEFGHVNVRVWSARGVTRAKALDAQRASFETP